MSRRSETGPGWDISIVRTLVDVYSRCLRELDAMRKETDDVSMLLSVAACVDEMEEKRAHWQRRLDRIEASTRLQAHRQRQEQERVAAQAAAS